MSTKEITEITPKPPNLKTKLQRKILSGIDRFFRKEKVYISSDETPPHGESIKTGPRGGKFYDAGAIKTDKKPVISLNRQYAAFKLRQKYKKTPEDLEFISSALGKLNKLNDTELKRYFHDKYSELRSGASTKFKEKVEKYERIISMTDFKDVPGYLNKLKDTDNFAFLRVIARQLSYNFHPWNPIVRKWIGLVFHGEDDYKHYARGTKLVEAVKQVPGIIGLLNKDLPYEEMKAKFLVGDMWSTERLRNMESLHKKYPNLDTYPIFVLALKPLKSEKNYNYKKQVYLAFKNRNWNAVDELIAKFPKILTKKELVSKLDSTLKKSEIILRLNDLLDNKKTLVASQKIGDKEISLFHLPNRYEILINGTKIYESSSAKLAVSKFYTKIAEILASQAEDLDIALIFFGENIKNIHKSSIIPFFKTMNPNLENTEITKEDIAELFVGDKLNKFRDLETVDSGLDTAPIYSTSGVEFSAPNVRPPMKGDTIGKQEYHNSGDLFSGISSGAPNKEPFFEKSEEIEKSNGINWNKNDG